jgi:uncharacterized membrane protein YqaE (UPF0057 family)
MRALFCIICPPFAILLCGKPISAMFNMFLCLFFWIPGVIHAFAVVDQSHTSKQTKQIVRAINGKKKKAKKPCRIHNADRMARLEGVTVTRSESYDDKYIGEGGTKFKRK